MLRVGLFAFASMLALAPACSPSETSGPARIGIEREILINGGFEIITESGSPVGWATVPVYAGKGETSIDRFMARSGNHGLRLSPNEKNTGDAFGVFAMLPHSQIAGKPVRLSGYVKCQGIREGTVAALLKTDRENWIPLPRDTQGEYVHFSKRVDIAADIPEASLLLLVSGTEGSVWFDDLTFELPDDLQVVAEDFGQSVDVASPDASRINTPGWQDSVFVSPDGSELYFAYLPYTQKDFLDLYFGRISAEDVKTRGPFRPGHQNHMSFDTYRCVRQDNGSWGPPENVNINSTYSLYSAKLSHDGSELYYAIRDYDGNYGADDIYMSKRQSDGSWSSPINLGPKINTRHREDTPCLSADGNTLYFGRNERETLGWEIWVSTLVDGHWTSPTRMPEPINQPKQFKTANYQPFITADGSEFYFTRIQRLKVSRRNPDGTWGEVTDVFPQLPVSGHASVTSDGRYLYFLTAGDKQSLKQQHWTIWCAERAEDGSWQDPRPVD